MADKAPDPQGKCAATQPDTCDTTGNCLKGACAYHDQGSKCKAAVCASTALVTPVSTCDGKGACSTPVNQPCGSFVCDFDACKTTCTKDTDCVAPDTCTNNTCGLKVNGAACTAANQCQSGFCTEGVCCNTACTDSASGGLCKTCKGTQNNQTGTCANVGSGGSVTPTKVRPTPRVGASVPTTAGATARVPAGPGPAAQDAGRRAAREVLSPILPTVMARAGARRPSRLHAVPTFAIPPARHASIRAGAIPTAPNPIPAIPSPANAGTSPPTGIHVMWALIAPAASA